MALHEWAERAECKGKTSLLFPDEGDRRAGEAALAICKPCRVRKQCRDYALEAGEVHGVWGGMGPKTLAKERKRLGVQVVKTRFTL